MKVEEKQRAIKLRKEGKTYSEILAEISVAKSTLSEWLKSVQLATSQKQRITKKKRESALRGAMMRRDTRLAEIQSLIHQGRAEVKRVTARELWLIGIALYWAEGSKQKENDPSHGVIFSNSDAEMVGVFLRWLHLVKVPESAYIFELYVHETRKSDIPVFKSWWAKQLGVPVKKIDRVYLKRGNIKTNRKNVADLYHGLVRIKVNSSSMLNRRINGWVHGIVASLGSGVIGNTSAFGAEDSRIVP
jgi:hypothetical protein